MANLGYALTQGIASGAQSAGGLIDASLKEDADIRAGDRRLDDQQRLLAAQEAMQERIAENAYQRQQRPNQAAGDLLRDANTPVPASPNYNGPAVNVSGTPDEVRAKLSAIPDPVERDNALKAYESQEKAKADVVGKTRAPTREEQIQTALNNAVQKGDAVSYERLKALAGDQYTPIPEGGLLNRTTGEVIGSGQSKADREREKDDRQYENRRQLQGAEDDRKDQRAAQAQQSALDRDEAKAKAKKLEPLPTAALKQRQVELDAIGNATGIQDQISNVQNQIDKGTLKFGLVGNMVNRGLNATGMSSEESRNFASFQSNMEKLRNDSLRLNAGVQTDGDAQRAWKELFDNINDTGVVSQRLGEIKQINARAVELRKNNVDLIQQNFNRDPFDYTPYERPMDKSKDKPGTAPTPAARPSLDDIFK